MQQEIAQRLRRLVNDSPPRRILGLAGCPGAGKSTLARVIVAEMPGTAIAVPMDGFHLANSVLQQFGRTARKGAPDTFDVDGYVALLARLRTDSTSTIYAPEFRRNVEEPVAAAIVVSPAVRLVVTEGNYLLHEHGERFCKRQMLHLS